MFPRPLHGTRAAITTFLVLALWAAVARQSGSGWVQAVGAVVAAVVVVGLLAPAAATATVQAKVTSSPGDGTVGSELRVDIGVNRTVRLTPVAPGGAAAMALGRQDTEVVVVPTCRGVVERLVLDAASAWPFGLLWWSRRLVLELPRPLYIAPRPSTPLDVEELLPPTCWAASGDAEGSLSPVVSGELRSTRAYHPGDDRRRIHWTVSAHTGELMIAEREELGRGSPVRVRADLPEDGDAAEERAGRVLGSLLSLLEQGRAVVLETCEDGRGQVVGAVVEARQARRRLALAVPAPGESSTPPLVPKHAGP